MVNDVNRNLSGEACGGALKPGARKDEVRLLRIANNGLLFRLDEPYE